MLTTTITILAQTPSQTLLVELPTLSNRIIVWPKIQIQFHPTNQPQLCILIVLNFVQQFKAWFTVLGSIPTDVVKKFRKLQIYPDILNPSRYNCGWTTAGNKRRWWWLARSNVYLTFKICSEWFSIPNDDSIRYSAEDRTLNVELAF